MSCLTSLSGTQRRKTHQTQPRSNAMHTAVWHPDKYMWQGLLGCTQVITVKTQQSHRMSYSLLLLMATLSYSIPLAGMRTYMRKDSTTCGYLQVHRGEQKLNASTLLYFLWHVHHVTSGCVKIYYVTWCSVTWWHWKHVPGCRSSLLKTDLKCTKEKN